MKNKKIQQNDKGERIAKVLARAGIASRREIERMIDAGRIGLHGEILTSPATLVTGTKGISVDGKLVKAIPPTRLWRFYKPIGQITTHKDEKGRKTVFGAVEKRIGHVISIGRLDINSEGLLLLTNDGELARYLELPSTGWKRHYRARVKGNVDEPKLETLKRGIVIDGIQYGPIEAKLDRMTDSANTWLSVSLKEGKNREVRKAMEHIGLTVNRLIRTSYGPFELGRLRKGELEEVQTRILKASLPKELVQSLKWPTEIERKKGAGNRR